MLSEPRPTTGSGWLSLSSYGIALQYCVFVSCLRTQYHSSYGHYLGNCCLLAICLLAKSINLWRFQNQHQQPPQPIDATSYKVYIWFMVHPSQEWNQSIVSIGPISTWFRPFHRQLYSTKDGSSSRIMESSLKSITPTNRRHVQQSLYMIHSTFFSRIGVKYQSYRPNINLVPTIP